MFAENRPERAQVDLYAYFKKDPNPFIKEYFVFSLLTDNEEKVNIYKPQELDCLLITLARRTEKSVYVSTNYLAMLLNLSFDIFFLDIHVNNSTIPFKQKNLN